VHILPVLLLSDLLIWGLCVACLLLAWGLRRNPLQCAAWQRVGQSRRGMAAATVLLMFTLLGLADSLHYRPALSAPPGQVSPGYAVEVRSALDAMLAYLRERNEKTYSQPFATRLANKETVLLPDGRQARLAPRLKFGGAHLEEQQESARNADVAGRLARALTLAICLSLTLCALATVALAVPNRVRFSKRRWSRRCILLWRLIWQGRTRFAWNAVFLSVSTILLLGFPLALLGTHYHVLGTDKVGQDVLYQSLKSIRTALLIGSLTTLLMLPFGILFGILAGYLRGWVDDLIQYVYTVLNSIPGVLLIAAAILMMQVLIDSHPQWFATAAERADARLLALCLILGLTTWTGLARLLRGEALKLSALEYVQAAEAFLVPRRRIVVRHILPNVMHIVIITLVMDFSGLVLAEAVLSYIGIGVDPSMHSYGMMINNARMELSREPPVWWSLFAAFGFMLSLVLAANVLADVVRDAFDPRLAP